MTNFDITRRGVVGGFATVPLLAQGAAAQGTPRRGGTLKVSHSTSILTLNVLQNSGPAEYLALDMIYAGLTRLDRDMAPRPDLAVEWSGENAARTFTFKLRPNVKFHDGSPFTSQDVVATIEAILDPKTGSPARPPRAPPPPRRK